MMPQREWIVCPVWRWYPLLPGWHPISTGSPCRRLFGAEKHPPMLARTLASLDPIPTGRLTINIIHSDLPGYRKNTDFQYQRCAETIQILKQAWIEPGTTARSAAKSVWTRPRLNSISGAKPGRQRPSTLLREYVRWGKGRARPAL